MTAPATHAAPDTVRAHLDRCWQVLNPAAADPAVRAWNFTLTPARKRLLLRAAGLPETLAMRKWETLPPCDRHRIKTAPRDLIQWAGQAAAAFAGEALQ